MNALLSTFTLVLLLSGCSSGVGIVSTDPFKPGKDKAGSSTSTTVPWAGDAALGLAASATTGSEQERRNLYSPQRNDNKKFISGRCVCRTDNKVNIDLPCRAMSVLLLDNKDKELTRVSTSSDFAFEVTPNYNYKLAVISNSYKMETSQSREYQAGDSLVINLVKK